MSVTWSHPAGHMIGNQGAEWSRWKQSGTPAPAAQRPFPGMGSNYRAFFSLDWAKAIQLNPSLAWLGS